MKYLRPRLPEKEIELCLDLFDKNEAKERILEYIEGVFDDAESQLKNCFIHDVSNSAVWKPTMILRWLETDNYNPVNDDFDKVLQQKWQSDKGEEKWEDIEIYGR